MELHKFLRNIKPLKIFEIAFEVTKLKKIIEGLIYNQHDNISIYRYIPVL